MKKPITQSLCVLAASVALLCLAARSDAADNKTSKTKRKTRKRRTTLIKVDPTAERVKMFAALADGRIDVQVVAKGPLGGKLLFENKTEKPLTVELPESFVGVQVFNQGLGAGGGGFGGGGQQGGGFGGGGQQGGGQGFGGGAGGGFGGGGQGGGFGGGGQGGGLGGGGLGGGGGGGLFSIPPEKIVSVPYQSVCLEHGKADPTPGMTYKLIPVEKFSKDPRVDELCKMVGSGRINAAAAQAAAWHLSNKMSWQELARKQVIRTTSRTPYFNHAQLVAAQRVVSATTARVRELAKKKEKGTDKQKQEKQESRRAR